MAARSRQVAVDLGSSTLRLHGADREEGWSSPHVAVVDEGGTVRTWGSEALAMAGRMPPHLRLARPVTAGAVTDLALAARLLGMGLRAACGRRRGLRGLRALVCVPDHATSMEQHVLRQVCKDAGVSQVTSVPHSVAAAVGARVCSTPSGALLVDVGEHRTTASMIAFGSTLATRTVKSGAGSADALLVRYARDRYGLTVGAGVAEEAKLAAAEDREVVAVRGQDRANGLPRVVDLPVAEIRALLRSTYEDTVRLVSGVLDASPAELVDDVHDRGLLLLGGGARLHGLDTFLRERLRIPAHVVESGGATAVAGAWELACGENQPVLL
ncbi:rod shape-determining protein [Streptomyces sp. NPDC007088]|uniref:rod shape-determining protein n=1 Tax=Streptomyces sp. NPDC007088 TaxID=3364773 RepID=UPI0036B742F1